MGSDSQSSSTTTSQDYSNSFNTTLTQSLGQNALGIFSGGAISNTGALSYLENSGNTTTTDNNSYSLGAGSSSAIAGSGSGTGLGSSFNWSAIIPYLLVGAVGIVLILTFKK